MIVAASLLSLVPPLLVRQIIDEAIPDGDRSQLNKLAALIVLAALGDALLALVERYQSSRIGEGIIYDLRVSLFDHVQRLPMSFFTRAQTGALTSRMNNDVMGAQRAVTGTLGSVVSNVVTLIANGAAIIFLDWRFAVITLLLLPLFIVPTKRVGGRLQDLTRQQMNLNASMNTTMTERFNVSGALLVKLFGRPAEETADFATRADAVRAVGVRSAVYSRTFFVALGLVGALAAASVYWVGGQMAISGTISVGTLVALATFVSRIYGPLTSLTNARVDVMTALVSFERVFEVLDAANPIPDRPGAVDLVVPPRPHRAARRPLRLPDRSDRSQPRGRQAAGGARRRTVARAQRGVGRDRTGAARGAGGPVGGGQDDALPARAPAVRRHERRRARRRHRRARPHAGVAASGHRHRQPGPPPVPRHHRQQPPATRDQAPPMPRWPRRCGRPGSRT